MKIVIDTEKILKVKGWLILLVISIIFFILSFTIDSVDRNKIGASDSYAAIYSTQQQVLARDIILFSLVRCKENVFLCKGFKLRVVYSPDIFENTVLRNGGYVTMHSLYILKYAMCQIANGDKELGLFLIKKLAEYSPDLTFSMQSGKSLSVKEFQEIIDCGKPSLTDEIQFVAMQWVSLVKYYPLPLDNPNDIQLLFNAVPPDSAACKKQ